MCRNQARPPDERYFGFGEKTGPLDKRGQSLEMWNSFPIYKINSDPLYQSIPFFLALRKGRAHGYFFDNPNRAFFDMAMTRPDCFTYRVERGEFNYYFIAGPSPKDVVCRYTDLTGRIPLPPLWALGYQQSRWSYCPEKKAREIARGFRDRDIPCDAIYLDIHYMRGYRIFTFHPKRFPDPKELVKDLAQDGFKTIVIVDPGVKIDKGFHVYNQGIAEDHFIKDQNKSGYYRAKVWPGWCHFPDFSKPDAARWWGDLHKFYTDLGVAGIWNDMNEICAWGPDIYLPNLLRIPLRPMPDFSKAVIFDQGRNTPYVEIKNAYANLQNKATYEGLLRLMPDRRPYIVTRAGYAGYQRHAYMWTGDNSSSWGHLALAPVMHQNLSTSGIPICGSDIGGLSVVGAEGWGPSPELYARWIQQGAFYTYCRTHTSVLTPAQEPWSFGEKVTGIAREYIKLRYRLLPYSYSLVEESTRTGMPVIRSMFLEFPEDGKAWSREQNFMYGPFLLVVPIVKKGARAVDVYLPEGVWYDYHAKQRIGKGPATLANFPAPLEVMPIFARAGAIIPTAPDMNHVGEKPRDPLLVEVFPGNGSFALYEDAGEGFDYRRGGFARTGLAVETNPEFIRLIVSPREGSFKVPDRKMKIRLYDIDPPQCLAAPDFSGSQTKVEWSYDNSARQLTVEYSDRGQAIEMKIFFNKTKEGKGWTGCS